MLYCRTSQLVLLILLLSVYVFENIIGLHCLVLIVCKYQGDDEALNISFELLLLFAAFSNNSY